MELPDDYFTEDDAIAQMQADDDYWMNYRRRLEEETMTAFVLENEDTGETLRIETSDFDGLALTVTDEDGAATIHLTIGQLALLRDWLTANVNACARCGGTGSVTVDTGATPWCTDFITLDCPACGGTGTPTDD
jgi:hypothetical protein